MKVLDPQSALLSNAEVYQLLQEKAKRPGTGEKPIGAYPVTNLTGLTTVKKDFNTYTTEITPYMTTLQPVSDWIKDLIVKLKPYELTKSEVLNLINIGIGIRGRNSEGNTPDIETDAQEVDEEAALSRDIQFFKAAVEEADDRFPGDEGEEKIREIISIMETSISKD